MPSLQISADMNKLKLKDQIQLKLDIIHLLNTSLPKSNQNKDFLDFKHNLLRHGVVQTLIQTNKTDSNSSNSKTDQEILRLVNSKYHIYADPNCAEISYKDLSWYGTFTVVTHFYQKILKTFSEYLNFLALVDELALNFNSPSDYYKHSQTKYESNQLNSLERKLYEFIAHFDEKNPILFMDKEPWWQKLFLKTLKKTSE